MSKWVIEGRCADEDQQIQVQIVGFDNGKLRVKCQTMQDALLVNYIRPNCGPIEFDRGYIITVPSDE